MSCNSPQQDLPNSSECICFFQFQNQKCNSPVLDFFHKPVRFQNPRHKECSTLGLGVCVCVCSMSKYQTLFWRCKKEFVFVFFTKASTKHSADPRCPSLKANAGPFGILTRHCWPPMLCYMCSRPWIPALWPQVRLALGVDFCATSNHGASWSRAYSTSIGLIGARGLILWAWGLHEPKKFQALELARVASFYFKPLVGQFRASASKRAGSIEWAPSAQEINLFHLDVIDVFALMPQRLKKKLSARLKLPAAALGKPHACLRARWWSRSSTGWPRDQCRQLIAFQSCILWDMDLLTNNVVFPQVSPSTKRNDGHFSPMRLLFWHNKGPALQLAQHHR